MLHPRGCPACRRPWRRSLKGRADVSTTQQPPDHGQAKSPSGRTFDYEGPADSAWVPGDFVLLTTRAGEQLFGQVLDKQAAPGGKTTGAGSLIGRVANNGNVVPGALDPFTDAVMDSAPPALLLAFLEGQEADMPVGASRAGSAFLRSKAFNRHTFMCGQSGSGKSYALGLLLEQLLIDTDIPLLVLDPNADFVGLDTTLTTAAAEQRERLAQAAMRIFRAQPGPGQEALLVRFTQLSLEAKAAALRLDPLQDREEYNLLIHLDAILSTKETSAVVDDLMTSSTSGERAMGQRIQNLGLLNWTLWASGRTALLDRLRPYPRATVLDLSGFEHARERLVASLAVLDDLWAHREERKPVLLVIDEAHNVCTNEARDSLGAAAAARLVQIASEGRKYGIWLLLCTQRPSRIPDGVLSQCDNLVLMRMNSRADLAQLEHLFGFAPREMLSAAPYFRQGECLMAGGFIPAPTFVQVGRRRTLEGGSDVKVPMPAS
jgi:uncharacterized protein